MHVAQIVPVICPINLHHLLEGLKRHGLRVEPLLEHGSTREEKVFFIFMSVAWWWYYCRT